MEFLFKQLSEITPLPAGFREYVYEQTESRIYTATAPLAKSIALCDFIFFVKKGYALWTVKKTNKTITAWIYTPNTFICLPPKYNQRMPENEQIIALPGCEIIRMPVKALRQLADMFPEMATLEKELVRQKLEAIREHSRIISDTHSERYAYLRTKFGDVIYHANNEQLGTFIGMDKATFSRLHKRVGRG